MPDNSFDMYEIDNPLGYEQRRQPERGRHRAPRRQRRRRRVVPIAVAAASVLGVGGAAASAGWFLVPQSGIPSAADWQPLQSLAGGPGAGEGRTAEDRNSHTEVPSSSSTGMQPGPGSPLATSSAVPGSVKKVAKAEPAARPADSTKARRTSLPRPTPTLSRPATSSPEPTSPAPTSPAPNSASPSPDPTTATPTPEPTATSPSPSPTTPTSPVPDLPLPDLPLPDLPLPDVLDPDHPGADWR